MQAGATDTMSADDMSEIEEELLSALPLGVDEGEVEVLALAASMQEASTAGEDDSVYRVPVSLNEARQYTVELLFKKISQPWSVTSPWNQLQH